MSDAGEGGGEKGLSTKEKYKFGGWWRVPGLHKSTPPASVKIRRAGVVSIWCDLGTGPSSPLSRLLSASLPLCLSAVSTCCAAAIHGYEILFHPAPAWSCCWPGLSAQPTLRFSCHGKRGIIDSSSSLRQGPGQSGMRRAMAYPCVIISGRSSALAGLGGWHGGD